MWLIWSLFLLSCLGAGLCFKDMIMESKTRDRVINLIGFIVQLGYIYVLYGLI